MEPNTSILERITTDNSKLAELADVRRALDKIEAGITGAPDAAKAPVANGPAAAAATATVTGRTTRKGRTTPMQAATSDGTSRPNAPTIEALLEKATDLGKQAGQGKDTQVKFDMIVAEAAYFGTLDLTANKHGNDVDDATHMSAAYVKAQQGAVIFDTKAPNQRKTISNTRKMIKLGGTPKWGPGEPLQTLNDLVRLRQKMRQDPTHSKKLDDAHNTVMKWATAQLKSDTIINDPDALKGFVFKKEAGHRDAEDVLESVKKTLTNLKLGKVSNCPDVDASTEVTSAIAALTKRLSAISKARAAASGTTQPTAP